MYTYYHDYTSLSAFPPLPTCEGSKTKPWRLRFAMPFSFAYSLFTDTPKAQIAITWHYETQKAAKPMLAL